MFSSNFKNIGTLTRFLIRRDRLRIPYWLIGISFFTWMVPISFADLYSTQRDRDVMAETMHNPAMTAMVGPGDLTNYTIGAMTAHQMLLLTAIVVGLMSILLVGRHTRTDEEQGRIEMIRTLPVGRLSTINATLLELVLINGILAFVIGFGLYALGIGSMGLEGSLLYGTTLGATGIFFATVTAVFAQLFESSRGVIGYSFAVLLVSYFVRAVGDIGNETLSAFSPLGWVTQTKIYTSNQWWPVQLLLGVSIILFLLANYLHAIRDLESGFIPAQSGRKHASFLLQSPIGLAFRLQRTGTISWAIGLFVIGASYGSVMGDLESFFAGNETLEQMLIGEEGYTLTDQFIPMLLMVMGILATVPPIMAINKLSGEEKMNRMEHLISRVVSRTRLMGSYLCISIVNGFIMISLATIGFWSTATTVMEEGLEFGTIYGAALAYYPAMLVMIGVAVLLIGFLPKLTSLIWLYVVYSFVVLYLGGLFQLPDWTLKFSPFGYVPQLPIEDMDWTAIIILCIIAVFIIAVGFIGYNKRDIDG